LAHSDEQAAGPPVPSRDYAPCTARLPPEFQTFSFSGFISEDFVIKFVSGNGWSLNSFLVLQEPSVEADPVTQLSKLACPICYYPLVSSIDHQSA
jgi:hypothetical protein